MERYLTDLIERMLTKEACEPAKTYRSDESISWKAYREAESLDSEGHIPWLVEYIPREKKKDKRHSAYFILGKLLAKLPNTDFLRKKTSAR